jgi:flagellar hook-associated protein 2
MDYQPSTINHQPESMSLSGINFSGLSSGIDTESIINQLLRIDRQPMVALQKKQQKIQQQQAGIGQISAILSGMQVAATALDSLSSFALVSGTSSDESVATITAESGAQPGIHTLQITQLAQAHRLASAAQSSQTAALGASGQIVINGKAINIAATDSLQAIAANINSAQAGVNAGIISTAANSYTLVLTSSNTGAANAIRLSDTAGGTILQSALGFIGPATSVRSPITNGAASELFSDSSTSIGTLLGLTSPQAGTIQINGTGVSIDFATDSLTSIANKINTAGIAGVNASVVTTTDPASGANRVQLQITGASTPSFTDSNNILTNLGVLQNSFSNQVAAGKDAGFIIDGLSATRSSNTLTDVISGVTINLLKDTGAPTASITISADTDTIKQNIKTFINQYNQLVSAVNNLASYDPQSQATGPLFGDVTVQNVVNSVTDILTGAVTGLTGSNTMLSQIGITLDSTGTLNLNESDLDAALSSNLQGVARIFQAAGVAADSGISFISSTDKTKPGGSAGYAVNITQLASQASVTAGTTHTANDNPSTETLTFTGGQFGANGRTLLLNSNSTLDDIISQINGDSMISRVLTASQVGGQLTLTAKQYGSAYNFTVVSSQAAAANNSGIGNTPVSATAVDVAGTINGEAATGNGQFLTGSAGNPNTDGLQIRVTSTTTGDHGTITFTKGLADQIKYYAQSATDYINGSLTLYNNSLSDEVNDISSEISDMQSRLSNEETYLRRQFTSMETALAQLKAAGSGLSALAGLTNTSSHSSSSSSSSSQ